MAPGALAGLRRLSPDIVHIFSYLPSFLTNALAIEARLLGLPLVWTPVYHPSRRQLYKRRLQRTLGNLFDDYLGPILLRRAHAVVALTDSAAAFYRSIGTAETSVIPPSADEPMVQSVATLDRVARKFGVAPGVTILCVGRVNWYKGVDLLVDLWPTVKRALPEARLLAVGPDAGSLENIQNKVRQLGYTDIVFTGEIEDYELSALYDLCDLVVSPSRFETFGITSIEAWAHRKPVVVFDLGGPTDHITAEAGVKVPPFSAEAMAEAIITLLRDKETARVMGETGYGIFQAGYTRQALADRYERVYNSVLRSFRHDSA